MKVYIKVNKVELVSILIIIFEKQFGINLFPSISASIYTSTYNMSSLIFIHLNTNIYPCHQVWMYYMYICAYISYTRNVFYMYVYMYIQMKYISKPEICITKLKCLVVLNFKYETWKTGGDKFRKLPCS